MKFKEIDNLYFYWKKINRPADTNQWKAFLKAQTHNNAGINGLKDSLVNYNKHCGKMDMFIVFISDSILEKVHYEKEKTSITQNDYPHIEIIMSASSSEQSEFFMNMGIFRPESYNGDHHRSLSMSLHSFAANVIDGFYKNNELASAKKYMLTVPVGDMLTIMKKKFENKGLKLFIDPNGQNISDDALEKHNKIKVDCAPGHWKAVYDLEQIKSLSLIHSNDRQKNISEILIDESNKHSALWFIEHNDISDTPCSIVGCSSEDLKEVGGVSIDFEC